MKETKIPNPFFRKPKEEPATHQTPELPELPELPAKEKQNAEEKQTWDSPERTEETKSQPVPEESDGNTTTISGERMHFGNIIDKVVDRFRPQLTNPKFSLIALVCAIVFCLTSCSALSSSASDKRQINDLKQQIGSLNASVDKLKNEKENLETELDEMKNGAPRLLEQINAAYDDQDWQKVVDLYNQLHEKFAGSSQDKEASEKYLGKAKEEIEKAEAEKKKAEEEKKAQEEAERKKKEEEEEAARKKKEEEEAKAKAEAEEAAKRSTAQKNAIKQAESYLRFTAFSRQGLIEQLEYEGYSNEDATYAVDHIEVDWNEQAYEKAKDYLDFSSFSEADLIGQLEYEGFTPDQAAYGAGKAYSE